MPAPPLSDDDVQQIVETTAQRVVRLLQRRGLLEEGQADPLMEQEPLLATITAASIQGQVATGARAGQRVRRRLRDPQEGIRTGPLCFASRGFSPHAATRVPAADRTRLERLCRYVNRPPLAAGRLQILDAETVAFDLKTPWDDGTYRIELSPQELLEKLAALVPPPRLNLVRYHGVLAANAADRPQIVPGPHEQTQDREAACGPDGELTPAQRRHRVAWADLLWRVFRIDVTQCPACGGRMKIVAALTEPRSIQAYLEGVGLPSRGPPIAPARPPSAARVRNAACSVRRRLKQTAPVDGTPEPLTVRAPLAPPIYWAKDRIDRRSARHSTHRRRPNTRAAPNPTLEGPKHHLTH